VELVNMKTLGTLIAGVALVALTAAAAPSAGLNLGHLARLGTVDDRYQA
jgi:hypothetical protein